MSRLEVLLVTPPYHSGVVEAAGTWLPLGLLYIAGAVEAAGHHATLYDAMSRGDTLDDVRRVVREARPDVVMVSCITATTPDGLAICQIAKEEWPGVLTVLGNTHPTFMYDEVLRPPSPVDVVVRGEGERTVAELLGAYAAKTSYGRVRGLAASCGERVIATPSRSFEPDLDRFHPAWDLVEWERYSYRPRPEGRLAIVSSSRGCRQRCSFCSQQKFWKRSWRGRRPEAVVGELEMLRDRHGVRVAMLADETPTADEARWRQLLELLVERRVGVELLMETRVEDILRDEALLGLYREAGVSHIYVGVESTDQATLDLYCKDLAVADSKRAIDLINSHDMVSETSFVLGNLGETPESIARTVELAKWYAPDMAFFLAITPWPYADLWETLADRVVTTDYRRYNLVEPVVEPYNMTIDDVHLALHQATGSFFRDKFERLGTMSPDKRQFMVRVLRLLIEHSYLGDQMRQMAEGAEMPPEVRRMLATLGRDEVSELMPSACRGR